MTLMVTKSQPAADVVVSDELTAHKKCVLKTGDIVPKALVLIAPEAPSLYDDDELTLEANHCSCVDCRASAASVELPGPLELSLAMRRTADWCVDPASPTVHKMMAATKDGIERFPTADSAERWCAVGYLSKEIGQENGSAMCAAIDLRYGVSMRSVWRSWDLGHRTLAAVNLNRIAKVVESKL